jgi:N-acetylneuraminic acid mutarotase
LYKYNIQNNSWSSLNTSLPFPRGEAGTTILNGKIYCMGGFNGSLTNLCHVYDIASNTWQQIANLPTAISGTYTAIVNGEIYIAGGGFGVTVTHFYKYNPTSNTFLFELLSQLTL